MKIFPLCLRFSNARGAMRVRPAGLLVIVVLGTAFQSAHAQIGNSNPTGPAGTFNGQITTGCSYDPVTGNAMRSVTDLAVAGGVGSYPLAFTRIANSRQSVSGRFQFGAAGAWKHSYSWSISGGSSSTSNSAPSYYSVSFPDGRAVTFRSYSTDSDPYFRGGPGIKERFQPLDQSTMLAFLVLPDGGKVEFKATRLSECDPELIPPCRYSYSYQAQAIIDPYGLRTTLTYYTDGSLNTIQEAAGRWIQLVYVTTPWTSGSGTQDRVIDHIQASDGRQVKYNYGLASFPPGTRSYTYLGNVVYYPDPSIPSPPTAYYTYTAPNVPTGTPANGAPLLASCNDPMYAGPMQKISYTYATSNADLEPVTVGQILSENSGTTGQRVSTLGVPQIDWRYETRGDGPGRHFVMGGTRIQSWTDFVSSVYAGQGIDANGFINSSTDWNGNTTNYTNHALTGADPDPVSAHPA